MRTQGGSDNNRNGDDKGPPKDDKGERMRGWAKGRGMIAPPSWFVFFFVFLFVLLTSILQNTTYDNGEARVTEGNDEVHRGEQHMQARTHGHTGMAVVRLYASPLSLSFFFSFFPFCFSCD